MYKHRAFYAEEVNSEGSEMRHPANNFGILRKIAIILWYIEPIKKNHKCFAFPPSLLVKEATKTFEIPDVLHISTGGCRFNQLITLHKGAVLEHQKLNGYFRRSQVSKVWGIQII